MESSVDNIFQAQFYCEGAAAQLGYFLSLKTFSRAEIWDVGNTLLSFKKSASHFAL